MSAPPLGTPARGENAPPWRLARFLRATVALLLLRVYRTRFLGAENLPDEGGYVLAGNHVSYLDPALLWCGMPRETHFMAREDLFRLPIVGWGLRRLWAFPVTRGSADREAIQRATDLLKQGEPVGIFPEGTRQKPGSGGELGQARAGAALIAIRAGAPVVPVGIAGTERALPKGSVVPRFPRVTVRFGKPVHPEEYATGGRRERTEAMTAEVMRRIAAARDTAEEG